MVKKLRRHEVNNIRKGVKFVSDKITELSFQCGLGKMKRIDANKESDRIAKNIVAKYGLVIALNIAGYFRAVIDKNAPDGMLVQGKKKVELIVIPFFEYFKRFNTELPMFIFQPDKKEHKIVRVVNKEEKKDG